MRNLLKLRFIIKHDNLICSFVVVNSDLMSDKFHKKVATFLSKIRCDYLYVE